MNEHAEHPAAEWFTGAHRPGSGRLRGGAQASKLQPSPFLSNHDAFIM